MSVRGLVIQVHVVLSCGVTLLWLATFMARAACLRRHHVLLGRCFVVSVVASTVSAVGLAMDARETFGALFALQPLMLCLSAGAQFNCSRWIVRGLGGAGLLVAIGVLVGFARLLASRHAIDVMAFAWAALTLAVLAAEDLRAAPRARWRAHLYRMVAVGWFYLAELGIFVFDPHPSVVAWAVAGAGAALGVWWIRRQPSAFLREGIGAMSAAALSAEPSPRR